MILDAIIGFSIVGVIFGVLLILYSKYIINKRTSLSHQIMMKDIQIDNQDKLIKAIIDNSHTEMVMFANKMIGNHAQNITKHIEQGNYSNQFARQSVYKANTGNPNMKPFKHEKEFGSIIAIHRCLNPNCDWNCPDAYETINRMNHVLKIQKEEEREKQRKKEIKVAKAREAAAKAKAAKKREIAKAKAAKKMEIAKAKAAKAKANFEQQYGRFRLLRK